MFAAIARDALFIDSPNLQSEHEFFTLERIMLLIVIHSLALATSVREDF